MRWCVFNTKPTRYAATITAAAADDDDDNDDGVGVAPVS